jgi:iron complex outermembrane recepter protein
MTNRFTLRIAALALKTASVLAISIATTSVAQAATAKQSFAIPAQNAAAALEAFGKQSGQSIIFDREALGGKQTKAINGRFAAKEALDRMLRDTGLVMKVVNSGAFVVSVGPQKAKPPKKVAIAAPKPQTVAPAPAVENAEPADDTTAENIVVIGTRLNEEYAGATPVQKIDQQKSAQSGLLDSAEILRSQPQVSGPRSQLRVNNNSTGAPTQAGNQTIALRGLLPEQTLVLLNGRRLVASGVENVPRSADISLIPISLVKEFEILTDGASPVYGTDAISGVINIKLRQDFEDTTLYAGYTQPERGSGSNGIISLSTGKTFDRGFIGFAAEYRQSRAFSVADASRYGASCPTYYDKISDGTFRDIEINPVAPPGTTPTSCIESFNSVTGAFASADSNFTLFYATPNRSNVAVPGWSVGTIPGYGAIRAPGFGIVQYDSNGNGRIDPAALTFDADGNGEIDPEELAAGSQPVLDPITGLPIGDRAFFDPDGDGKLNFDPRGPIYDYQRKRANSTDFIAPLKQLNLFTYGQYDFDALGDATAYFEAAFSQRRTASRTAGFAYSPFILPSVAAENPFNPCGIETPGCFSIDSETPVQSQVFPLIKIEGDGDFVRAKLNQYRFVGGLRGDLNLLNNIGGFSNWRYDVSVNYNRSSGVSDRPALLRDRLIESITTTIRDPDTGRIVCGADNDGDGLPDQPSSCVPVNLFTPAAMLDGRLTAAEYDYLLGNVHYETNFNLLQTTATFSGDAITLPGGPVSWVLGAEYRTDSVDSQGNEDVQRQNFATLYGGFDTGAKGKRTIKDVFGEIGIPIIRDKPFFHALTLSAAGRITDEEFSGTNNSYSLRGRYEPVPWFALRGTYGRSLRSPNTFELFRKAAVSQQILNSDPCLVPLAAATGGVYDASRDNRPGYLLERCRATGADPSSLGLNRSTLPRSTIVFGPATRDSSPETSKAWTAGAVLSLDDRLLSNRGLFKDLSINLSATYYDIRISNEIRSGNISGILGGCYELPNEQQYCSRITRGNNGFITDVAIGLINLDGQQITRGLDWNALVNKKFNIGSRPFNFSFEVAGNYEFEVSSQGISDNVFTKADKSGTFNFPKLKLYTTAQLKTGPWVGTWYSSFIGSTTALGGEAAFPVEQARSCLASEPVICRPAVRTGNYLVHNMTIGYQSRNWSIIAGVNNLFDRNPPRISAATQAAANVANSLLNSNYDVYGRTFTFQVRRSF